MRPGRGFEEAHRGPREIRRIDASWLQLGSCVRRRCKNRSGREPVLADACQLRNESWRRETGALFLFVGIFEVRRRVRQRREEPWLAAMQLDRSSGVDRSIADSVEKCTGRG